MNFGNYQRLKGLLIFVVIAVALIGVLTLIDQFTLTYLFISIYTGLFAIYVLSRLGFFANFVKILPHGQVEYEKAKIRRIPALGKDKTQPKHSFVVAEQAQENGATPNLRVIGVESNRRPVAFAIRDLGMRNPIQFTVNSRLSYTVSWWPITYSARIFESDSLVIMPYVVNNSIVYTDKDQDMWIQFDGQKLVNGSQPQSTSSVRTRNLNLKQIPTVFTTWQAWMQAYPNTEFMSLEQRPERDQFEPYYASPRAGAYAEKITNTSLDPKEVVIGLELGDQSRAWAYADLIEHNAVNEELSKRDILIAFDKISSTACIFERRVSGRTLTFKAKENQSVINGESTEYAPTILTDNQTSSEWHFLTGECIQGEMQGSKLTRLNGMTGFWFAWIKFHPNTTVFNI